MFHIQQCTSSQVRAVEFENSSPGTEIVTTNNNNHVIPQILLHYVIEERSKKKKYSQKI